jgi:hypothetical protein
MQAGPEIPFSTTESRSGGTFDSSPSDLQMSAREPDIFRQVKDELLAKLAKDKFLASFPDVLNHQQDDLVEHADWKGIAQGIADAMAVQWGSL